LQYVASVVTVHRGNAKCSVDGDHRLAVNDLAGAATVFRIFISYSHEDEGLKKALEKHLAPLLQQGRINPWSDRQMLPGARLFEDIQRNIEGAHIILLLISADYLASKACREEMETALRRNAAGDALAVPVIVRSCDWTITPLGKLLAANEDGRPINSAPDHDVAWTEVAVGLRRLVNDWEAERVEAAPGEVVGGEQAVDLVADELSLKTDGEAGERWVNRREENERQWQALRDDLADSLGKLAENDKLDIGLDLRPWGDKFIVDFTLPQHTTSRRMLIHDIGGYSNYPGYQFESYASDDRVNLPYRRVRWIETAEGKRLRQTRPKGSDFTVEQFAEALWNDIYALARPMP
jgi:hypothetical protein